MARTMPMYIVSDTSTSNDVGMYLRVDGDLLRPQRAQQDRELRSVEPGAGSPG